MDSRKKYEMYFMTFWILTLIPSASIHFDSNIFGILSVLAYLTFVGVFGYLSYKKTEKQIALLESTMEYELQL
ncbi:hypothetical protein [Winogradskyella wichelsiae]|uniref:hypothetical protein n=1 Tax=Winogradskyella wichelsiae TaxID=2697007 RepID=UPI003EF3140D